MSYHPTREFLSGSATRHLMISAACNSVYIDLGELFPDGSSLFAAATQKAFESYDKIEDNLINLRYIASVGDGSKPSVSARRSPSPTTPS